MEREYRTKDQLMSTLTEMHGQNARPTIAYLTTAIHGSHPAQWFGVVKAAQKHDVSLICFPGRVLRAPRSFQAQANVLYDLVDARKNSKNP